MSLALRCSTDGIAQLITVEHIVDPRVNTPAQNTAALLNNGNVLVYSITFHYHLPLLSANFTGFLLNRAFALKLQL